MRVDDLIDDTRVSEAVVSAKLNFITLRECLLCEMCLIAAREQFMGAA